MLHHCFTQPTKWTKKTNGLADMWASRSKPKKALDLHPTAGILLQYLIFFPQRCWNRHSGWLTCGPTKLTRTEGFVNLVNMNDSSSSDRTMSIQRP